MLAARRRASSRARIANLRLGQRAAFVAFRARRSPRLPSWIIANFSAPSGREYTYSRTSRGIGVSAPALCAQRNTARFFACWLAWVSHSGSSIALNKSWKRAARIRPTSTTAVAALRASSRTSASARRRARLQAHRLLSFTADRTARAQSGHACARSAPGEPGRQLSVGLCWPAHWRGCQHG